MRRCWDDFISKLGPVNQRGTQGVNIVSWFEMVTFDVLGEMAFGEGCDCVENGGFQYLPHQEFIIEASFAFGAALTTRIHREAQLLAGTLSGPPGGSHLAR